MSSESQQNQREKVEVQVSTAQFDSIRKLLEGKDDAGTKWIVQWIAMPIFIALAGWLLTYTFSKEQAEINRVQTMEKFVSYFSADHSVQQQMAALVTMIQLGYENLATDLFVFSFATRFPETPGLPREGQPDIWAFLRTQGPKLLPRLCYLSRGSAPGTEVAYEATRYAAEIARPAKPVPHITQGNIGFELLKRLAAGIGADQETQDGALVVLVRILGDHSLSEGAEDDWLDQEEGLRKELEHLAYSEDQNVDIRARAVEALAEFGESAVPGLRAVLARDDFPTRVQLNALFGLMRISEPGEEPGPFSAPADADTVKLLDRLFQEEDVDYELKAVIVDIRAEKYKALFAKMLRSTSPHDRLIAIRGLTHLKSDDSVPLLLTAYSRETEFIVQRYLLAKLWVFSDSTEALKQLKATAQSDQSSALKEIAFQSICKLALVRSDIGKESRDICIQGLDEKDTRVVAAIMWRLGDVLRSVDEATRQDLQSKIRVRIDQIKDPAVRAYFQSNRLFPFSVLAIEGQVPKSSQPRKQD